MVFFRTAALCAFGLLASTLAQAESWQLSKDEEGIRVYLSEVQGSKYKAYRGVTTIKGDVASLRALPASPFARAGVRDGLAAFARPGFHPTDRDTSALTASWAARLAAEAASMDPVAPPADV